MATIDIIQQLTHKLHLYGIHETALKRAEEALSQSLHPLEFLELILHDENLNRKNRFAKQLLTKARFRNEAMLEEWDGSFDRGITKQKVKEISSLSFILNKQNLIILGKTGEGKTHLGIAIGRRLCLETIDVKFFPVNIFFEEVLAQKSAGTYLKFLSKHSKTKCIILDDFGLRNYSHDEAMTLMDLLEDRYSKNILIITSQVDPQGWKKLFEDPVIAEAIVDRMINPSQIITLKGGSYRERLGNKLRVDKMNN